MILPLASLRRLSSLFTRPSISQHPSRSSGIAVIASVGLLAVGMVFLIAPWEESYLHRFVSLSFRMLVSSLIVLLLLGCASLPLYTLSPLPPGAVELPFESLASKRSASASYEAMARHPTISVLAAITDIEAWDGRIEPGLINRLRAVDYDQYFVIIAFRGARVCLPPENMRVLQVVRRDRLVQVYVHFPEYPPFGPSQPCLGMTFDPVEIVQVPRQGVWHDTFTFDLMNGPGSVATVEHWIP